MKATDEYRQKLVAELIEQSARIDVLVINSRLADDDQELEALRAQQQETTKKLQALEDPGSNAWENIGDGG
jgi:short-subunit dehydrogenase